MRLLLQKYLVTEKNRVALRPYIHSIPQKGILRKERVLSPNSSVGVLLQDKFDKIVWLGGCGGGILFSPKPSSSICKKSEWIHEPSLP
ncbi:unnamed protein product [Sphenostylis stenocarpa]|uniref:Uncharacterized protein n=1 Tax=Sphenostylis stenocarpa TaxID=92480 RepID=A0AA86S5N9_9FABA|nr:unnamed protein product [Sphenostylis stenocarpa]